MSRTVIIAFCCTGVVVHAASGAVVTTFSTGFEGWTSPNSLGLTWQSTGGNPGGYIRFEDLGPANGGQLIAPASYLGDWSAANGVGFLSIDYTIFRLGVGPPFTAPGFIITGPGGSASWYGPVPTSTFPWTTFTVPINSGVWNVTSGTWTALLANVTELRVMLPSNSGGFPAEITGADNIVFVIPAPGSIMWLACAAMVACGRRRRP
jgi:hypothetical protein